VFGHVFDLLQVVGNAQHHGAVVFGDVEGLGTWSIMRGTLCAAM